MMYVLFYLIQFEGYFGYVVTLEMIVCKFIMCMVCKTSFWDSTVRSAACPFIAAHPSKCCSEVQRERGLEIYEAVFLYIKNISKICSFYLIHKSAVDTSVITGKEIITNKGRN